MLLLEKDCTFSKGAFRFLTFSLLVASLLCISDIAVAAPLREPVPGNLSSQIL